MYFCANFVFAVFAQASLHCFDFIYICGKMLFTMTFLHNLLPLSLSLVCCVKQRERECVRLYADWRNRKASQPACIHIHICNVTQWVCRKKCARIAKKHAHTHTKKYICQAHFHPLCEFRGWKMRKSFFINHAFRMLFHVQNMFNSARITCYITKQISSKVEKWMRVWETERVKLKKRQWKGYVYEFQNGAFFLIFCWCSMLFR